MKRHYLYILTSFLWLVFFLSCGTGANRESVDTSLVSITVDGNGDKVKLKIEKNTPLKHAKIFFNKSLKPDTAIAAIPSNIYKIDFTITAPDMTTITKKVLITGQDSITETFTIPNGKDRYFLVEAKDLPGYVIYEGSTTADLDGIDKELNISMASVDRTPPTVKSVSPANGATDVSISTTITATFSETIDSSTFNSTTFSLSDSGSNIIAGATSVSSAVATFTPSNNLSYSTTYTATINTGVKDDKGNAIESSYTWTFTTGSAPDTTAPTVSSMSPANGATDVSITTTITATFSEAMDSSTITTSTFTLSNGGSVSGTVTYSGTTATFTPSSNLSYSTTYTATITTGVKDSAGNAMAINYSWTFTTGSAPDTTAPTVSSTSPANNATGVAINSSITATFSENMDTSTITTATFTLSNGGSVLGTVTYSGTTATWTPSANLSYNTTYTATITTSVKDSAGNTMSSNYSWTFTTGSAPDTTAPTVSSTSPSNGATSVAINTSVTATFSEAMDTSTVTTSTFTLSNGGSVSGTVTYSGTTATFTPTSSLAYNTPYTATITTGVKDSAGNAMASNYTWSFTTTLQLMGGSMQGNPLSLTTAVTTFAGSAGLSGSTDGIGSAARFYYPYSIATDGTNLFVADTYNHTIRKIVISTGEVTTIAGSAGAYGSTDGTGTAARFSYPEGITTDGTNLFVADTSNSTVRKIVISTGEVTTIAGSAALSGSTDGTGSAARFSYPLGITTDGTNLFVADTSNHTIRKIVISTGEVTTIAGSAALSGSTDGTGAAARFNSPHGITTDETNLFVADMGNSTVRKVVISTGEVTTIAGSAGAYGSTDGTGSAARFSSNSPCGITTDGTNLFVTDMDNHTIRKIVISTGEVTTIAGSAGAYGSTDGTGTSARFYYPAAITTDGTNLFVADTFNYTIRKIQ